MGSALYRSAMLAFATVACILAGSVERPPAVPLVTHNPYLSVWSPHDRLTDGWPTHWSGAVQAIAGLVRIDGTTYRWCGPAPASAAALEQRSLTVTPTRTTYAFAGGGIELDVTFLSPVFADDPMVASFAASYLTCTARSADGKSHEVTLYVDCSAEWAVHEPTQEVTWNRGERDETQFLRVGTTSQAVLARCGDRTRIDWGWFTITAAKEERTTMAVAEADVARNAFASAGSLAVQAAGETDAKPRAAGDRWPVLATRVQLGSVTPDAKGESTLMLAYDERECVEFMGTKLRPYWTHDEAEFGGTLTLAWRWHDEMVKRAAMFDERLRTALDERCGPELAKVCALAYRQIMAAHVIATDAEGTMLMFSKENTSNGCIGTVDVLFPSAPMFLALAPDLLEAQLRAILTYAASPQWKFPFAPHDLGTYPKANGQVYGGGERDEANQMPVEECGNLLILCAALSARSPGFDVGGWWPQLTSWANYLKEHGLDPANQLCTDDFAGHLARNANLSVKAIVALGAYAQLCESNGTEEDAKAWRRTAEEYAKRWLELAADGDHTALAFGSKGTWSLKYNLAWDRVLGTKLFPAEVAAKEVAFYMTKLNRFGVPMDSRAAYTKPEWMVWAATLAEKREDFQRLVAPIATFARETPDRVPMSDWYMTDTARDRGMHARSVLGGLFMPLLQPVQAEPATPLPKRWSKP